MNGQQSQQLSALGGVPNENTPGIVMPGVFCPLRGAVCQAQLEPTAESVLLMLLPADCTFWPWELACS
jgi:hypothetical protein